MATTIDQLDAKIDKLFQAVLETNKQVMEIGITLKNTVNDVEEAKKSRTKIYDKLDQYRDEIEELKHRPEKEAYEREKDNKSNIRKTIVGVVSAIVITSILQFVAVQVAYGKENTIIVEDSKDIPEPYADGEYCVEAEE